MKLKLYTKINERDLGYSFDDVIDEGWDNEYTLEEVYQELVHPNPDNREKEIRRIAWRLEEYLKEGVIVEDLIIEAVED